MKKHLTQHLTLILLTALLTACGGGGGGGTTPAIALCQGSDQGFAKAKTIEATQTITKTTPTTELRIWHTIDGKRKACIVSGEAEVQ